jgi:TM2 domain-containing membrane protein YozV
MIGHLESYDNETKTGVIKSEEKDFQFHFDNWTDTSLPEVGDVVNFVPENMTATDVKLLANQLDKPKAVKFKYLAIFLAIFFGWLGLHRFYLGYYQVALTQLALSAVLIYSGFIVFAPQWGFIDALLLFSGNIDKDAKGRPLR